MSERVDVEISNVKQMRHKRELLFKYYMDNPSLSEHIDYESDKKRARYYYKHVMSLNYNELEDELNEFIEGV